MSFFTPGAQSCGLTLSFARSDLIGGNPVDVAVADFNRDGKQDLVSVSSVLSAAANVQLGNGDGSFLPPVSYSVDAIPASVAVGDFNGDNNPDIVTKSVEFHPAGIPNTVSVLLGNGDGTFHSRIDYYVGRTPAGVTIGDLNADGHLDILTANLSSRDISVLFGNGDGSFLPTINLPFSGSTPNSVSIGDFNQDGRPDLAVTSIDDTQLVNTASALLSNGDGTFQPRIDFAVGFLTSRLLVSDFNEDGHTDIVTMNYGGQSVSILLGDGTGSFQRSDRSVESNPQNIAIGDFNADDIIDIATANSETSGPGFVRGNSISILLGNGDGSFRPRIDFSVGRTPISLATTDFNQDGKADIVTVNVNYSPGFTILLNTSTATNQTPMAAITSPSSGSIYQEGSTIDFTGSFADSEGDTHTAQWNFWSINSSISQTALVDDVTKTVSTSLAFNSPGVYQMSLSVTDSCGQSTTTNTIDGDLPAMIVVYDPNGGFVTGGGWIESPPGAYLPDSRLAGRASFGFVSKYLRGATIPTGNTEFQFRTASFNFSSTSYDWLVIAGARAQYKGSGRINGAGDYSFMLTAIDGQVSGGGGADRFRIKIWDRTSGGIIYDNQLGVDTGDNATPQTVVGGGRIVIQKD